MSPSPGLTFLSWLIRRRCEEEEKYSVELRTVRYRKKERSLRRRMVWWNRVVRRGDAHHGEQQLHLQLLLLEGGLRCPTRPSGGRGVREDCRQENVINYSERNLTASIKNDTGLMSPSMWGSKELTRFWNIFDPSKYWLKNLTTDRSQLQTPNQRRPPTPSRPTKRVSVMPGTSRSVGPLSKPFN